MLQRIKYGGRLALAEWAGAALASAVRVSLAGRNGRVIARTASWRCRSPRRGSASAASTRRAKFPSTSRARTGLPLAAPLVRVAAGPPQTTLPWAERGRNVRGAFAVSSDVRGARIALVDDVMTTGATLAEASRTLIAAGAERVECWVVARTLPP